MIAIVVGVVLGCLFGAIVFSLMAAPAILRVAFASPTSTRTATPMPTETSTPTATFTASPLPTSTFIPPPTATRTPIPTRNSAATPTRSGFTPTLTPTRAIVQHFIVGRPVATNAPNPVPDPIYLYGTTQSGTYDVHHGDDYDLNPVGTPLYAVADGTVVVAGSDVQPICGDDRKTVCGGYILPGRGFYGKLIVIQLSQLFNGQRVFALYGHMNKITVSEGDHVKPGDPIGEIGASGIADGPHVHFEIRLGVNDYGHTRNPILWRAPLPGRGSLAGRYADPNENPIRGAVINIYRANGDFLYATETYSRDKWLAVNDDDDLEENFAAGDLAPGDYIVKVQGTQFAQRVTIQAGKLSFVDIGGSQ